MRSASCIRKTTFCFAFLVAFRAHAGIDIDISGVTPALENNIREFLSMSRYTTRNDLDAETVARLERRIPTEVRKALEPLGYYAATATYTTAQDGSQWKVHIAVDAGRAIRVAESKIDISGEGRDVKALRAIVKRGDLHPGSRLDHGVYEGVKAELLRVATNEGYLDAKFTTHDVIVDVEMRRATIALALDTGARYRFGKIKVQQPVLKDKAARRLLRMHEGDPYLLDALLESQYVLDDSQYFKNVEINPGVIDRTEHEVPVEVRADKNKRNLYAPSIGYGTDTRWRGKLTWDNRYVNSEGHRSEVNLIGSAVTQEANVKYVIPVMDIALEKFQISVDAKKELFGDITSRRTELAFGLTQALGSWQRVTFIRFSNETNEGDSPVPVPAHAFLIIPGFSYSTLPPSLLDRMPRRYSLYAELSGSPETLGS
ncbi:MAG TPA: POTRA domain-containing protein, partial [Steroidobacteraceae bacterium]|nr:POTRA domain-containing protein [Steroidobacteraceae bacterium]